MKYCLNCGTANKLSYDKCSKCSTSFGSVKIESINYQQPAKVIINKPTPPRSQDEDYNLISELDFDFEGLAQELENEFDRLYGNESGHKTISGRDLFQEKQDGRKKRKR